MSVDDVGAGLGYCKFADGCEGRAIDLAFAGDEVGLDACACGCVVRSSRLGLVELEKTPRMLVCGPSLRVRDMLRMTASAPYMPPLLMMCRIFHVRRALRSRCRVRLVG